MSLTDVLITVVVLSGAIGLLYRSFTGKRGACHGCSSGGACGRRDDRDALVPLGQPRSPGKKQ